MHAALVLFYSAIGLAGAAFIIGGIYAARRSTTVRWPTPLELIIGLVTDFFDTLGIGSFAPTTAYFKLRARMPDEQIPGTLNVGQALPSMSQALIFISIVRVDLTTLFTMIAAAVLGAWFGVGWVARLSRRAIQLGMGGSLLCAAMLFFASNVELAIDLFTRYWG